MLRGLLVVIIGISTVLQVITAYLAFRLLPLTRWRIAWSFVSVSLLLTAALKAFRLIQYMMLPELDPVNLYAQVIELLVSAALLAGIYLIRPLFEASRKANEIYELFVQKSVQGLVIFQQNKVIYANPAFAYLTGRTLDELIGMEAKNYCQMFHPFDRENLLRTLQASDLDTPSQKREIRIQNRRGNIFWVEGFFGRAKYSGKPAIQMTFVNITDRKRIEQDLHESERRHRIISQLTSDYIYSAVADASNHVHTEWVSGAFDRITGYTLEEILAIGPTWDAISHPDDKLKAVEAHTFALSNQPIVIEYRIISKHGEVVWLRDYLQPIWNEGEKRVTHFIGAVQDISDRKNAETGLKNSEARWRSLAENAPTIIATLDPQHHVTWMNRAISRPLTDMLGKDFHAILPSHERGKFHRALRQIFTNGAPQHLEIEIPGSDDQPSWFDVIIGPILQEDVITSAILVLTNITERKYAEEQLKFLSNHDILTGLFNRAFFETELRRLQKSRLYPVTVVMADVNNLKNTNDIYGHAAGDDLLRTIAQVMREAFRSEDVVARIGGDEFAVILPEIDEPGAQAILNRLKEKLDLLNRQQRDSKLSLSIGAATGKPESQLIDVMKEADNLMYEDKARQKSVNLFMPREDEPHDADDLRI